MATHSARKIFVTGCGGFVGGHLVNALRSCDPDVHIVGSVFDTSIAAPDAGPVEWVALDVTDQASVEERIRAARPDAVVHLAALSTVTDSVAVPTRTLETNLLGTLNLAQAVLAHAPQARFLFVGSSEAYGATLSHGSHPLDEDAPFAPTNPYATSKAAADLMIGEMAISRGLRSVRFRPFNHTGPGQDPRFVVPAFARQIARIEAGLQEPVLRVGDLTASRDICDVRDVVGAYTAAALGDPALAPGVALNLASGATVTIRQVLDTLVELSIAEVSIVQDADRVRPAEARYVGADISRAQRLLGWQPRRSLRATLTDTLNHFRGQTSVEADSR